MKRPALRAGLFCCPYYKKENPGEPLGVRRSVYVFLSFPRRKKYEY